MRKRATSFLSAKDTSDESLFWSAMPQYRTIPAIIVGSAFGAYFRTSAAQSSEMAFLPVEFSRNPCLQTLPIRNDFNKPPRICRHPTPKILEGLIVQSNGLAILTSDLLAQLSGPIDRQTALSSNSPLPRVSGLYVWLFREAPPVVSMDTCVEWQRAKLLYIGISPNKLSKPQTRNHFGAEFSITSGGMPKVRRCEGRLASYSPKKAVIHFDASAAGSE